MDIILGLSLCFISVFLWVFIFTSALTTLSKYHPAHSYDTTVQYSVALSIVSALQGVLSSAVGITIVLSCRHDVIKATHPLAHWYAWVAMGYFLYDLWAMYQEHCTKAHTMLAGTLLGRLQSYCLSQPVMITHHATLATVLLPMLIYRRGVGEFFVGCFYCLELSALFTNLRSAISKLGYKNTRLYKVNGLLMVFTFATCRVAVFPFMYWCYGCQYHGGGSGAAGDAGAPSLATVGPHYGASCGVVAAVVRAVQAVPLHCTVGCAVVLLPQLYWLGIMVKTALRMIVGKDGRRETNKSK